MSGEEEHRHVGAGRLGEKGVGGPVESQAVNVGVNGHIEVQAAQGVGEVGGVIGGIGEASGMGVGRVADHQRDPPLGRRLDRRKPE